MTLHDDFALQRRPAAVQWPGELPAEMEATAPRRWRDDVQAARSAALALYSCAGSRRNRMLMRRSGVVPLLARLLHSDKPQLLVPIVGILNHFAKEVCRRQEFLWCKDVRATNHLGDRRLSDSRVRVKIRIHRPDVCRPNDIFFKRLATFFLYHD